MLLDDGVRPLRGLETLGAEKLAEPLRCLLEPLRAAALVEKIAALALCLGRSGATTFSRNVAATDARGDAVLSRWTTPIVSSSRR